MHCHANARLTPRGRAEVFAAVEAGMAVATRTPDANAMNGWSRCRRRSAAMPPTNVEKKGRIAAIGIALSVAEQAGGSSHAEHGQGSSVEHPKAVLGWAGRQLGGATLSQGLSGEDPRP